MLISFVISLALGHEVDAIVIILVVIANTVVGYIQEDKAEKSLEAIQNIISEHANVIRSGKKISINTDEVVTGDIVALEPGDKVPADLRIIACKSLKIDESILTGESVPVEKSTQEVVSDAPVAERACMSFYGTFVSAGQGVGLAVSTGKNTEIGRINALLKGVKATKTPLLKQMDQFGMRLTAIIILFAAALFVIAYWYRDYSLAQSFMIVVGFSVAVIPEGLPAVMTIALAIGVHRMAKRNAIIRHLPAVETLGSVSTICSDKTGTLTCNEMTVKSIIISGESYDVSGAGYNYNGSVQAINRDIILDKEPVLYELCRGAVLCNDATVSEYNNELKIQGDSMEAALIIMAIKAGIDPVIVNDMYPRIDGIPFDSDYKFMVTQHHDTINDSNFIVLKGAPEKVISMCDLELYDGMARTINPEVWLNNIQALASKGQRVLALATKLVTKDDLCMDEVRGNLCLIGLVGLIDPPRKEAIESIADCHKAGIRIIMITGDHLVTASAIAKQLGISENPKALYGQALDNMSDSELKQVVKQYSVFARANPEHKLRLVRALQANQQVVAMTGDGVNDAPALKQADVGIAMGLKGTDVAREAAKIVLADDNFVSITAAVQEGRTVYDNVCKVIAWTLPTNVGQVLCIIIAVSLDLPLPITPVQTLWVNMISSVALGLVLAFEPTEPGTMLRPPRKSNEPIVTKLMAWRIIIVSLYFTASVFWVFDFALSKGLSMPTANTLVLNTLVMLSIFYLFNIRFVHGTSLTMKGMLGTGPIILGVGGAAIAQLALIYLPILNKLIGTTPLTFLDGMLTFVLGLILLFIMEFEKFVQLLLKKSKLGRNKKWN